MREWCDQAGNFASMKIDFRRKHGKRVLFGGGFDLLHRAHIEAMKDAAQFGDYLIVNVLSDARLKAKKGPSRPIIPEDDRIAMVEALSFVDEVVCLKGVADYPVPVLLRLLCPDVMVVNADEYADYSKEQILCDELGIQLIKRPRIAAESGLDTTKIIAKIRS